MKRTIARNLVAAAAGRDSDATPMASGVVLAADAEEAAVQQPDRRGADMVQREVAGPQLRAGGITSSCTRRSATAP
jgi:hypothetical protein